MKAINLTIFALLFSSTSAITMKKDVNAQQSLAEANSQALINPDHIPELMGAKLYNKDSSNTSFSHAGNTDDQEEAEDIPREQQPDETGRPQIEFF